MTAYEVLKPLKEEIDYSLDLENRLELVNRLINENESIIQFISQAEFKRKHGAKKKGEPLSHEDYFCKQLEQFSDYLLKKYDEYEDVKYKEYTVLSDYVIKKDISDRENKRIVGINTDVMEEDDELPATVVAGLEIHIDMLDQYTTEEYQQKINTYKLSEKKKKQLRDQTVQENLDKYPILKENYEYWRNIGLVYGLSNELSKKEKEKLKQYWLKEFEKDNYPMSPRQRYYKLRKMYNAIGYELSLILTQLQKLVKRRMYEKELYAVDYEEILEKTLDLTDQRHINALLTIQKGKKVGEYYPLYKMIEEKYKDDKDSKIHIFLSEFKDALNIADLSEMQRDIVNLIIDKHDEMSIYHEDSKENPYKLIAKYINERYNLKKEKRNIIHIVKTKISRIIANTYIDLEKGLDTKKCSSCGINKMASIYNFGKDKRNKDGLKSICKRCAARSEKSRRKERKIS